MRSKIKLYLTILLLLAVFILSVSFVIDLENITKVIAQDSRDSRRYLCGLKPGRYTGFQIHGT